MAWTFNKPVFRPSDISTGLVGYWKFNNDATDSSSSGYNLTAVNTPTYVAASHYWKDNYSTDLVAASSQHFTVADADPLDLVDAFTIAGWIKCDDITSTTIIDKGSGATGWCVQIDGSSKLVLNMNNGARATSATALVAGKWTHFTARYTQAAAEIFLDGNLDISSAYSTDCQATSTALYIGVEDDASTAFFDGKIADLAIWNVALTPLQIKSLALGVDLSKYAYRPNNVSTQPTHWWKLNEVSGDRADSVSTNPLTATDDGTTPSTGGYIEGVSADFIDANADYLSVAADASHNITSTYSASCWFQFHSGSGFIYGKTYATGYSLRITASDGGTVQVVHQNSVVAAYIKAFNTSTWYHCGIVFDDSANTAKIYLDGELVTNATGVTTNPASDNVPLTIGLGNGTDNYDGRIADLAIWNGYALTDAEIKSLACALPIQRQGIVSYWKMDETSGNRADSIGSNTLVDNNSVLYGTGKVSNAADFEVDNDEYFSLANNDSIDIVSDLSIIGWMKPESVGGDYNRYILEKAYATGYGIRQTNDSNGKVGFYIANNNLASTTACFVAATWVHVVGVYDQATQKIYIDGKEDASGAWTTNPSDTSGTLYVGASASLNDHFDGLMDELILAKRYFRPEEIKAVYLKGLNAKEVTTMERAAGGNSQIIWID